MMFKNETVVVLSVTFALGLFPSLSVGAEKSTGGVLDTTELQKAWREAGCMARQKADDCKGLMDTINSMSKGGVESSCNDPLGDFNKAKGEFVGACSDIPTGESSNPSGNIACAESLLKCACRFKNTDEKTAREVNCPMKTSSSGNGELIDTQAARERFQYCPMLAAEDIDKIEQDLKELKKEIKEEEKKIPELQEAIANAQSQGDEKVAQIKQQMADAAKEYGKAKQEAKKAMEEAHNQLAQQLLQLGEEISKVEEQRGQIKLQRTEASVKRMEAISAIDLGCHNSALAQIEKMQAERLVLERSNNLNRGGFNNMLKNIGVSDRQSWQRVALKYYNWCIQSKPTRLAKENAGNIYESAMKTADAAEKALDRRQDDIRKRMNKIKSGDGCTGGTDADGSSNDSAICQATRKALEEGAQADRDYQNQSKNLVEQGRNAQMDTARKVAAKSAALQKASADVAGERARIGNLADFLAAKREYSGGSKISSADKKDAYKKMGVLEGAAATLVSCTLKKDPATPDDGYKHCAEDPACQKAANFWYMSGGMPKDQWAKFQAAGGSGSGSRYDLGPESGGTREKGH